MSQALLALTLAAATLLDVAVQRVNDRRSAGRFSGLEVQLAVPAVKSGDVAASRVFVSAAADDTGRDLVDRERGGEPPAVTNIHFGDPASPATVSVMLASPARNAAKVKEVRGEIELYMPGKDPNSTAEIPKVMAFSGKPLAHKALKANGVEIALVSPSQIAAEKKKLGEAKKKEYADSGYDAETIDEAVKSYVDGLFQLDAGDVLLRVKDPSARIEDMAYIDGAGELKRAVTRDEEGFTILTTWGETPKPDWKLRVSMRTAKSVVRHPFVIQDVPLP